MLGVGTVPVQLIAAQVIGALDVGTVQYCGPQENGCTARPETVCGGTMHCTLYFCGGDCEPTAVSVGVSAAEKAPEVNDTTTGDPITVFPPAEVNDPTA
jgi:hypothetical protein